MNPYNLATRTNGMQSSGPFLSFHLYTLLGCWAVCVEYVLEVSAVIPNALNLICSIPLFMGKLPYARTSLEGINCALHGVSQMVPAMVQGYGPSHATSICHNDIDGGEENLIDDYSNSEKDTLI